MTRITFYCQTPSIWQCHCLKWLQLFNLLSLKLLFKWPRTYRNGLCRSLKWLEPNFINQLKQHWDAVFVFRPPPTHTHTHTIKRKQTNKQNQNAVWYLGSCWHSINLPNRSTLNHRRTHCQCHNWQQTKSLVSPDQWSVTKPLKFPRPALSLLCRPPPSPTLSLPWPYPAMVAKSEKLGSYLIPAEANERRG